MEFWSTVSIQGPLERPGTSDWPGRGPQQNITVEEAMERAARSIPIGRMIEVDDIANLVLLLVSEKAGAITGQSIAVDGGATRGIYY